MMKFLAKVITVAFLLIPLAFAAEPRTAVLNVKNMQCPLCSMTIKKMLNKVPGVEDAKVDFGQKTATVKFDPARTNPETLIDTTTAAGFPSTVQGQ